MRTFITAAALLVVAAAPLHEQDLPQKDVLKVLNSLRSWGGQVMEAAGNVHKGRLAVFKGLVSYNKAYRLKNGQYCREMVVHTQDPTRGERSANTYFTIPDGTNINPSGPDEGFLSKWTALPGVSSDPMFDVRCLAPQRALVADASENRGSEWRQAHGSGEWVRLELPRSGMPCVRGQCRGELRCEQTSVLIPMCTDGDLGELSLTEIFAAAIGEADDEAAGVAESAEPVSQNSETAESAEPASQNPETALKPVTPATPSTRGKTRADILAELNLTEIFAAASGVAASYVQLMKE